MTLDDVKEAYISFLKAEQAVEDFKRICETKEEAMEAEADRMCLIVKSDIADQLFRKIRRQYISEVIGDAEDELF